MEYFVPFARTRDALEAVRASLDAPGFYPTPVYLRFSAGGGDGDTRPPAASRGPTSRFCLRPFQRLGGPSSATSKGLPRNGRPPALGKMYFQNPRNCTDAAAW